MTKREGFFVASLLVAGCIVLNLAYTIDRLIEALLTWVLSSFP